MMEEDVAVQRSFLFPGIYSRIRPLGAVSAMVLVVAAVVALVRPEMRTSGVGQAIATHALCLAAACLLQMVAYLHAPQLRASCIPYSCCAYFFRVAADVWLSALTFNRYEKFSQPLGVLARTGRETGGKRMWKRFFFMSIFAWGLSTFLTVFTVSMFWNRGNIPQNVVLPSFIETRTCLADFALFNNSQANIEDTRPYDPVGSLCYYYIPMMFLVITNGVLAAKTVRRVCILHRGTTIISPENNSSHEERETPTHFCGIRRRDLELSWFYMKILLTTNIIGLSLEMIILFSLHAHNSKHLLILQEEDFLIYPLLMPIKDLCRALSVLWVSVNHEWWSISHWIWVKKRVNEMNVCKLGRL